MELQTIIQSAIPLLTHLALKVVGALVLWVVARRLIHIAVGLLVKSLKYPFDQTVAGYIGTAVYFDTNRAIREVGGAAGFPAPEQHIFVRSGA